MRFMWIWQTKQWPHFEVDAQALQPALSAARLAQGRMLGVASNLQLVDLSELQLSEWTQEAMATAQIEGEPCRSIRCVPAPPGDWA
jgi:Fic family protein